MDTQYQLCKNPPEIWGGIECTINRVGDKYRDQLKSARHFERTDDISRIAQLGIKKLRYPILWEAHQFNNADENIDWTHAEKKLNEITAHGIEPIVGLVHHGSGPSFTSLSDKHFGKKLAQYAQKVATKFPHLKYFTPVNEPLTTARFSGLYGLWYPHKKSPKEFCRMLINQLNGIILSMQAIRKIIPEAALVQTEDLAKIHSSKSLVYQAQFENQRSWLTYDFLCGKFDSHHPLWNYFISMGIEERELYFFMENPCVPNIAGFNYYVTSERYLDEHLNNWPAEYHGGNDQHKYADVPAVRALKPTGLSNLLKEAWDRYQLPFALTEVHINCTREEQLRWFKEAYDTACKIRKEGLPFVAITAWSLLGAFDWNSLLTRENNFYEAGAFDISNNRIRETAMAGLIQSMATKSNAEHPLLNQQGWWHYSYNPIRRKSNSNSAPILILGGNGTLGSAFRKICDRRNIPFISLARPQFDITQKENIEKAIDDFKPWAVINTTGFVKVDEAETNREICRALNTESVKELADACNRKGIQLMTFSSDLVFDGEKKFPYLEQDEVAPLNYYGYTKACGEKLALENFPQSLIIRTSSFFGPWDHYNFAHYILEKLQNDQTTFVVDNITVSPTYVPHLVDAALDLLIDRGIGIWHLCNDGKILWTDFARELANHNGFANKNVIPKNQQEMNWKAIRPVYSALESGKGIKLPSLENAIECFFEEKI
ncbi:MAG: family 1 glycosylhydrolase [Ginsengibacter sp.]